MDKKDHLPDWMIQRKVRDLHESERGYIDPHYMFADGNGKLFLATEAPLLMNHEGLEIMFENGEYFARESSVEYCRYELGVMPEIALDGKVPVCLVRTLDKKVKDLKEGEVVFIMTDNLYFDLFGRGNIPYDCEYFLKARTLRYIPIRKLSDRVQIEKKSLKDRDIVPFLHRRGFSWGDTSTIPISLVDKFDEA